MRTRLAERGVGIRVTEQAQAALVREGYDPAFGARPMRRTIQRRIENELARRVLAGDFADGDDVVVDLDDGGEFSFAAERVAAEARV